MENGEASWVWLKSRLGPAENAEKGMQRPSDPDFTRFWWEDEFMESKIEFFKER